jgi:replicative DNA helicase
MAITEREVIFNLFNKEEYVRKVIPFLRPEYFSSEVKPIFEEVHSYFTKYGTLPAKRVIEISLDERSDLPEQLYKTVMGNLNNLKASDYDLPWLIDSTETFCKDRAMYNALTESISIADGDTKKPKDFIPILLSEALAVSFDTKIGHDYFEDAEKRFEFYHNEQERISTDISIINRIIKGGFPRKTLSVFAASTGVGKSLTLGHFAKVFAQAGYNVVYFTMELSEEMVGERIDANMLDIKLDDIRTISKELYFKKMNFLRARQPGRLVIKEYPTGSANVEHFKAFLRELNIKKLFTPDIIIVDYLTICSSVKFFKGDAGSYFVGKAIAEEVRGLGCEQNAAVLSAVQFNRSGQNNSDSDLSNIAESAAIAMTADFVLGMISTDELRSMNQVMCRQLKNRFGDLNYYNRFIVGIDYPKMRVYEIDKDESAPPTKAQVKAERESEELYLTFKEEGDKFEKAMESTSKKSKFDGFT